MSLLNRDDILAAAHDLYCVSVATAMEENGVKNPYPRDWEAFTGSVDKLEDSTQLAIMWRIIGRVEQAWGYDVGLVFHHAGITDPDRALYYLFMGCMGHGVSLADDYGDAIDKASEILNRYSGGAFDPSPIDFEEIEWRDHAESSLTDDDSDEPAECEECGDTMDRDCNGNPRCPTCDEPCPCCYDGGGPV